MSKITKIRLFFGLLYVIIIASVIAFFVMQNNYFIVPIVIFFFAIAVLFFSSAYCYRLFFRTTSNDTAIIFAKKKHLNYENFSKETKKSDEDTLKKFFYLIYPNNYEIKYEKNLFMGEIEKHHIQLSNFYFIGYRDTAKTSYFIMQPEFVLKTSPIKNFDNTILITPSYLPIINSKILSEIYADTHNQLNIYAKDAKKAIKYVNNAFLSALIEYYHKINTKMALILTPENIFFIKPKKDSNALWQNIFFISAIFCSTKSIEEEYQREYNQILDILKVLNLLKKD